jgi:hypothetical protein
MIEVEEDHSKDPFVLEEYMNSTTLEALFMVQRKQPPHCLLPPRECQNILVLQIFNSRLNFARTSEWCQVF